MYHQMYPFENEKNYYVILCIYIVPRLQQKEEMIRKTAQLLERTIR